MTGKTSEHGEIQDLPQQAEELTAEQAEQVQGGAIYMKVEGVKGDVKSPSGEIQIESFS